MASLELAIAAAVAHYTKDADKVREYIARRRAENATKELEHIAPYLPAKLWKIARVYRAPEEPSPSDRE